MKILLVAPQSKDTILGVIGNSCREALATLGHTLELFDFRSSQYFRGTLGIVCKNSIRKAFPFLHGRTASRSGKDVRRMNESLLECARRFRPDICLVLMGETILPDTIEAIKAGGAITVNWFHDTILAPSRRELLDTCAAQYDYFFVIDFPDAFSYYRPAFRAAETLPLGCDPALHKSMELSYLEKKKYGSDVSFVGTVKFNRQSVLESLAGFDLGIWGNWVQKSPQLENRYRQKHVYGSDAVKIYNSSRIVLDIPVAYGESEKIFYLTPRVFEVPACGAFLLTKESPYLSQFFKIGEEIVCYRDEVHLKELIAYYLEHPRLRVEIAMRGRERAFRDHTYMVRLSRLLSVVRAGKPA